MNCCNQETTSLGCFDSCSDIIDTGIIATTTGEIDIHATFNGVHLCRSVPVEAGESIKLPNIFNENYTHAVNILDAWYSITIKPCVKSGTN